MCGINGFNYADKELLHRMEKFTEKRGPDANGYYIKDGISLGHNRLSIIDISENANQPLEFKDYVITFNGEIYNYKYLREMRLSMVEEENYMKLMEECETKKKGRKTFRVVPVHLIGDNIRVAKRGPNAFAKYIR